MSVFNNINTFIFDVDGVLTDGSILSYANHEYVRNFYIKDGYAIEKALLMGYQVVVISGGYEEGVKNRLLFLGIQHIFLGIKEKVPVFEKFIAAHGILAHQVLYMGDDIPDLKILRMAGVSACPSDAADDVKPFCQYVSPFPGGRGAVRDVIEKTMKAQGKWVIDQW